MESPPARHFQSLHQKTLDYNFGWKSKKWGWFFFSSPRRGWGVNGIHGLLLDLPLLPLPFILQHFLQSLPSLVSRVLACSWVDRERVSVANERMSERVWLQLRDIYPISCWHVGPTPISGKQLISKFLLLLCVSPNGPVESADYPITCCWCWFDSILEWFGIGVKLSCPRVLGWGWISVDDVNRMTLLVLVRLRCCSGYEPDHGFPKVITCYFWWVSMTIRV
jgi:hypothetical protein